MRPAEGAVMPKFTKLNPNEVVVGRGRAARAAYVEALRAGDARMLELQRGEKPASVKRLLREAAKEAGIRIRSSCADQRQQVLSGRRSAARAVFPARPGLLGRSGGR